MNMEPDHPGGKEERWQIGQSGSQHFYCRFFLFITGFALAAGSYDLSSWTADGGGGASKGGNFTEELDFYGSGAIPFNGEARYLEIGVKPSGSSADFSTFSARQSLNPAPYAIYAASTGEHNHLGETWVGDYNDMVITGTFSGAALVLSNLGLDGLIVEHAGDHGVSVYQAAVAGFSVREVGSPLTTTYSLEANGFEVEGTMGNGLYVGWADKKGVYVYESSGDGFHVRKASGTNANGLYIGETDNNGVFVNNVGWHGLLVSSAGGDGVSIGHAKGKGVHVGKSDDHGLNIQSAGGDGVHVDSVGSPSTSDLSTQKNGLEVAGAEGHGVFVDHADINGLEVGSTGFDGLYVGEAGRDGVRVVSVNNNGLSVYSATNDGVYIEAAGGDFIQAGLDSDPKFKVLNTGEARSDVGFNTPANDFAELIELEAIRRVTNRAMCSSSAPPKTGRWRYLQSLSPKPRSACTPPRPDSSLGSRWKMPICPTWRRWPYWALCPPKGLLRMAPSSWATCL